MSDLIGCVSGGAECGVSTVVESVKADIDEVRACDEQLSTSDAERRLAMLAAMEVSAGHSAVERQQWAWSVEACLSRFTDKETLSGLNMITCGTCSQAAAVSDDISSSSSTSSSSHRSTFDCIIVT